MAGDVIVQQFELNLRRIQIDDGTCLIPALVSGDQEGA
jgi:hypothetical protein